jgi:Outer membrane protein beta-barrel domain
MKQIALLFTTVLIAITMQAQEMNSKPAKKKLAPTGKANDHFMLQFTVDSWMNKPDSIKTKGIGKGGNIYFMMNFPFKTNKKLSAAIGLGFGTSGVFLDRQRADIAGTSTKLNFKNLDTSTRFKKYKVATTFLEVPLELRYFANPNDVDHSWKVALGVKVGTLLDAHTKGRNLQDKNGNPLSSYTEKIKQKRYFNSTRIALTARIGFGHFSIFGQYQVTNVFKDSVGPEVKPFSIGIALSGL